MACLCISGKAACREKICKKVNLNVTSVGFPKSSLEKWAGGRRIETHDDYLTIIHDDSEILEYSDEKFHKWKNGTGNHDVQRVEIKDLSSWCKIEYETTTANPLHKGARLYLNGEEVINLTIPSDVTELDFAKFYGCSSIKTITIGSHVSTVTNRAFAECKNLQKVTASNGLTKIGPQAFYRCQSLTNIEIPQSITNIGNSTFYECKSLSEIMIPDNVTSIDNYAFESCSSLTSVTIGSGIQNIGKYAFNRCALENIYCHATTPPALGDTNVFWNNSLNLKIYVPWSADDSIINAYKAKSGWAGYVNRIYSMNNAD